MKSVKKEIWREPQEICWNFSFLKRVGESKEMSSKQASTSPEIKELARLTAASADGAGDPVASHPQGSTPIEETSHVLS